MKLKHVKTILISTAGFIAIGGTGAWIQGNEKQNIEAGYTQEVTMESRSAESAMVSGVVGEMLTLQMIEDTEQGSEDNLESEELQLNNKATREITSEKVKTASADKAEDALDKETEEEASDEASSEKKSDNEKVTKNSAKKTSSKNKSTDKKSSTKKSDKEKSTESEDKKSSDKESVQSDEVETSVEDVVEEKKELVIATVDNYVNIRNTPDLEGEVIGKLYNYSVGTLEEETEDGWYLIHSGSVHGYVKAEYVLRGEEGQALADQVGQRLATVTTMTLKVRMEASTEAKVLGLIPEGDTLAISEEVEGWVKVNVEEGEGYVSTDYVDVYTKNVEAESKEEEEARLAKEEEERRLAQEAAEREIARQQAEAAQKAAAQRATASRRAATATTTSAQQAASSASSASQSVSSSGLGSQIANYGLQFVGNPYVFGGTSLTNGTDCSGFVQSVYRNFGISLPRTSGEQGQSGTAVSGIGNAVPGDLIWYSGHIGIYIGNGQIVHASNPSSGIKVSSATYRSILSIRRIV